MKEGLLKWAGELPVLEGHQVSVFTNYRAAPEKQRAFAEGICERWNRDGDLVRLHEVDIEISIGTNALVSFACNTYTDVVMKAGRVPLHVVDYAKILERIQGEQEAQADEERRKRRENPVRNPAFVAPWIRWSLAAYLRLEYGEYFWDRDSVKPWHLEYLGEFVIDGVPTRYWRYPTSDKKPHYATVERFDAHICLGMTSEAPPAPG